MRAEEFQAWRSSLGLTQNEAASQLGVSKRSIANYESGGPIPRTVELACKAITLDAEDDFTVLEKLVLKEAPPLGTHLVVLPFVAHRAGAHQGLVVLGFNMEVGDWIKSHAPSARLLARTVITPARRRREVAVVAFDTETEAVFFKLRWC